MADLIKFVNGTLADADEVNAVTAFSISKISKLTLNEENASDIGEFNYDRFINRSQFGDDGIGSNAQCLLGVDSDSFPNGSEFIFSHGYDWAMDGGGRINGSWGSVVTLGTSGNHLFNIYSGSFSGSITLYDNGQTKGWANSTLNLKDLGSAHVKTHAYLAASNSGFGGNTEASLYLGSQLTQTISITDFNRVTSGTDSADYDLDIYFVDGSYHIYKDSAFFGSGPVPGAALHLGMFGSCYVVQDSSTVRISSLAYVQAGGAEMEFISGTISLGSHYDTALVTAGSGFGDTGLTSFSGSVGVSFDNGVTYNYGSFDSLISTATPGSEMRIRVTATPPSSIVWGPGSDNFVRMNDLTVIWG